MAIGPGASVLFAICIRAAPQFRRVQTTMLDWEIGAFTPVAPMTTQTPIDPRLTRGQQKVPHVEVYWKAVTYKTVVGYSFLGVAILFGGMYLAKPDWYTFVYKKFTNAVNSAVSNTDADPVGTDQKHAKFVNLDGKVQVKKVNSVQWV